MRPAKLKVGLVQQAVADNDKATNWNKSAEQIAKLAAEGCECILLQELHSTLYFCPVSYTHLTLPTIYSV